MKVDGRHTRTIWVERAPSPGKSGRVGIIDQTRLPHACETASLTGLDDACHAIAAMLVRGAPLIGATAAYGVALAVHGDASDARLADARERLLATRPTAVNLRWALDEMIAHPEAAARGGARGRRLVPRGGRSATRTSRSTG